MKFVITEIHNYLICRTENNRYAPLNVTAPFAGLFCLYVKIFL
jgi:hypothetical protein